MSRHMTALFLSTVLLGACADRGDPTYQPSGYAFHREEFKAAPGPTARPIGYKFTTAKNTEVLDVWQQAASDFVDLAQQEAGLAPEPVYLAKPRNVTAFNTSFDNALRGELQKRGFTLLNMPDPAALHLVATSSGYKPEEVASEAPAPVAEDGPVAAEGVDDAASESYEPIAIAATEETPPTTTEAQAAPAPEGSQEYVLALDISRGGVPAGHVAGRYNLPAYGTSRVSNIFTANPIVGKKEW